MKVVILCGGMGTRLREETEYKPKPMIEIGEKPIIWHIMKIFSYYGFNEFVLCLGYKGEMIKEYFVHYQQKMNDLQIDLSDNSVTILNSEKSSENWKIILANTGETAMTGARVKKIEKYIDSDNFILTYGDGLADINLDKLVQFHGSHGRIGTVTGVRPPSRFGELLLADDKVIEFSEKPQVTDGFINGGFFVFNKKVFQYLNEDDNCILEQNPLKNLAKDRELMVYKHTGFWQCMDTYRDLQLLQNLWAGKELEKELHFNSYENHLPPWKIWS